MRRAPNPSEIAAVVAGRAVDPFALLGRHGGAGQVTVTTFVPDAKGIAVIDRAGQVMADLACLHDAGFFHGAPAAAIPADYRLRVRWSDSVLDIEDPYRFPTLLGETDAWLIAEGRHLRLWEVLGAHAHTIDGVDGTRFALWAPNASRVSVVGDFNGWDGRRHPMRLRRECGTWEIFLPGVGPGAHYKYELLDAAGRLLPLKADPFAFAAELRPATASVVTAPLVPVARGGAPSAARDRPVSIYELHAGSWRRGEGGRHLSWSEIADRLLPYVTRMGFTHVELLPVTEHPFDGSWGYQPTGLFAPTARHGTPAEFAAFVSRCHAEGIGVLLDWVPGHFPADAHALARFDGTHLYEHADPRQGVHRDWNTLIYNYARNEVRNFLTASGLFWLQHFGLDGLRVDAVASMLYLDYSRQAGDWVPNAHGGRENLDAVAFLREFNRACAERCPDAATIAEESTAWPGVSRPVEQGGLGFRYKWNMGWMHDTLAYFARDPVHRRHHQNELTFGLVYAFHEDFVLPLSHDEVVHGKRSLLGRMPGDRWQRFANLRAYYGFMWTHPGKKLLFMGGEFAQEAEWNHDAELSWGQLADPLHAGMQRLVADLNRAYRRLPALHECDCEPRGFEWLDFSDHEQSVVSYARRGRSDDDLVVAVLNLTPVPRHGYRIGVPRDGRYEEIVNTDSRWYGGSDLGNGGTLVAASAPCHGRAHSLSLTLPPLSCLVLEWKP